MDREPETCTNQSNVSASITPVFANELRIHPTRTLAGNPDSPQAVVFLASLIDIAVGS